MPLAAGPCGVYEVAGRWCPLRIPWLPLDQREGRSRKVDVDEVRLQQRRGDKVRKADGHLLFLQRTGCAFRKISGWHVPGPAISGTRQSTSSTASTIQGANTSCAESRLVPRRSAKPFPGRDSEPRPHGIRRAVTRPIRTSHLPGLGWKCAQVSTLASDIPGSRAEREPSIENFHAARRYQLLCRSTAVHSSHVGQTTASEHLICYIGALDECTEDDVREMVCLFEKLG